MRLNEIPSIEVSPKSTYHLFILKLALVLGRAE